MFHYCLFLSRFKLIRIRSEGAVEVGVVSVGAAAIAAEAEAVSAVGAVKTIEIRSTIEAADAVDSGAVLEEAAAAAVVLGRVSTVATKVGTGSGNRSAVIAEVAVTLTIPETLIAVETVLDRSRRKTRKLSSTNRHNLRVPGEY